MDNTSGGNIQAALGAAKSSLSPLGNGEGEHSSDQDRDPKLHKGKLRININSAEGLGRLTAQG